MTADNPHDFADLRALAIRCLKDRVDAAEQGVSVPAIETLAAQLSAFRQNPQPSEAAMIGFANRLGLEDFELLAFALCLAVEDDPMVARMMARAQDPVGGSRPVVGLLATLFREFGATPLALAHGALVRQGVLAIGDERAALPERTMILAPGLAAALAGHALPPPGLAAISAAATPLPDAHHAIIGDAMSRAARENGLRLLVVRSLSEADSTAIALELAMRLGQQAIAVESERLAANAAWLLAANALPVLRSDAGPGERIKLPDFAPYQGLVILCTGLEGRVQTAIPFHEIRCATPDEDARTALWLAHGADPESAAKAAAAYRQGPARIAELARQAALGDADEDSWMRLTRTVRSAKSELDGYARRSYAEVERSELILPADALSELDMLIERIRQRNRLADHLGPGIARRYSPGVRALFSGESGTGKTLAAHWLSAQSGLPLYRVDQAVLTSKWIGETEKNLSAVLDAAQNADVLLFFDEADALFGARTDVNDAHDRHANAQTNYLLQRIEDYEGVVIMATNSRDRFDPAFVRRIDCIVPFPMPDAGARLRLWQVHLGDGHAIDKSELGEIAGHVELSGGHIRNIVLAAAVRANMRGEAIAFDDIAKAAREEYSKLGRPPPDFAR
jgi:ATPase family associated with various cellular activities (AAA)